MKKLFIILSLFLLALGSAQAQDSLFASSSLHVPLSPAMIQSAVPQTSIVAFRQTYEAYSIETCYVSASTVLPFVTVTIDNGSRVEHWRLDPACVPATGSDGHMAIVNYNTGSVYEMWQAVWHGASALSAGGGVDYAISGDCVTANANFRSTASGIAGLCGQIQLAEWQALFGCDGTVPHTLTGAIPSGFVNGNRTSGFVAPAVGSETQGTNPNGYRMGELFTIDQSVNIDTLTSYSPVTRTLLRTVQRYGLMLGDSGGQTSGGGAVAVIRIERDALITACHVSDDGSIPRIESEVTAFLRQYGLLRITNNPTFTPTPFATNGTPSATIRPSATLGFTPIFTPTATITRTPVNLTPTVIGTPEQCGVIRQPHLSINCP